MTNLEGEGNVCARSSRGTFAPEMVDAEATFERELAEALVEDEKVVAVAV